MISQIFSKQQLRIWRDLFPNHGVRYEQDPFRLEVVQGNTVVANVRMLVPAPRLPRSPNGAQAYVRGAKPFLKFAIACSCNSLADVMKKREVERLAGVDRPTAEIYEESRKHDFGVLVRMLAQYMNDGTFDAEYNKFFNWNNAERFGVKRPEGIPMVLPASNVKSLRKEIGSDKWSANDQAHLDELLRQQEQLNERLGLMQAAKNEGCSAASFVDNLRTVGANWNVEISRIRAWLPLAGITGGFESEREPDSKFSPVYMLKHHIKYVEIVFSVELTEYNFPYRFEIWPADTIGLRNQFGVRMEILFDSAGQMPATDEAVDSADRAYAAVKQIVNEFVGQPFTVENLRQFHKRIKEIK